MSYALCPNLEKCLFFAVLIHSEKDRDFFVICFLYTSGQIFFSQTPGRRPPHITGLRVNSVTLGWVGAPNERAPFRFHDAIAFFADRCLTRTRIADQGLGGVSSGVSCAGESYNLPVLQGVYNFCPDYYCCCR